MGLRFWHKHHTHPLFFLPLSVSLPPPDEPPRFSFPANQDLLGRATDRVSGAEVINVDPFRPSAEFVSVHRRRLITTILKALRRHEEAGGHGPGMYKFPSATWFSLWLSDMDRLEGIAAKFERSPRLAYGLHKDRIVLASGVILNPLWRCIGLNLRFKHGWTP